MKNILITGNNSFVGKNLIEWLTKDTSNYVIDTVSLRDQRWKEKDFSKYDVVVHLAGIAHVSTNPNMEELYYKVNRDLTIEAAQKCKSEGVKQFIFMSSIIVYGDAEHQKSNIDINTVPNPSNFYGKSKLLAEYGIKNLADNKFKIAIIRPPMIYGRGSKGNYPKLSTAASKIPFFPNFDNQRSMIHIENLCEFIKLIILNEEEGVFFPQNKEYVKTSEMVSIIAETKGKKVRMTKMFNPLIKIFMYKTPILKKMFGNLTYDKKLSEYKESYNVNDFKDSIFKTEQQLIQDNKLDVLIMCDNCLDTVGGEQESTKIIINGTKDEFKLGVIQPGILNNPGENVEYYQLTTQTRIKHLIKSPLSFMKYILQVRNLINQKRPELIHTQAQVSFFIVALLRKYNLIPNNIKIIHTERGLYTKYNDFFKGIFHFFLKEIHTLVTTTEFNMKYWKKALEFRENPLNYKVIENTAGELFENFNSELVNSKPNELVIGFAGRYCDWKNWPLAVEICKELNNKIGSNLKVKMAVGCLDNNAEKNTQKMFKELEELLDSRFDGLINIDISEMNKFYYDLDVFVLTSNYNTESFGRTLVEAMSRKTVVLTTNAGGSVEVVGDQKNVLETTNEFVQRILMFYYDKALMEKEKNSNLKKVKERYSLGNNLEKHNDLYSLLINRQFKKSSRIG